MTGRLAYRRAKKWSIGRQRRRAGVSKGLEEHGI